MFISSMSASRLMAYHRKTSADQDKLLDFALKQLNAVHCADSLGHRDLCQESDNKQLRDINFYSCYEPLPVVSMIADV